MKQKPVFALAFFALFAWTAAGQTGNSSGAKSNELNNAAQTVQQMTSSNKIPHQLLSQAECIGVIPNMAQGAFIVGGKHGAGVVSCRKAESWSAPAFFSISGASIGLQAGGSNSQIILLMNKQGEQKLLNGNFQLSAGVAAQGPNGSDYNASAGWKAPVLSYKSSNGAFAGVKLQGGTIQIDNSAMQKVYGSNASAHQVLSGAVQPPSQAQSFLSALPKTSNSAAGGSM